MATKARELLHSLAFSSRSVCHSDLYLYDSGLTVPFVRSNPEFVILGCGFVVLPLKEVELEAELLAESNVSVVLFDMASELIVELLDVLSLCDISGGADTLFEELSPLLQTVTEKRSKTADKTAIILFILYTSFR